MQWIPSKFSKSIARIFSTILPAWQILSQWGHIWSRQLLIAYIQNNGFSRLAVSFPEEQGSFWSASSSLGVEHKSWCDLTCVCLCRSIAHWEHEMKTRDTVCTESSINLGEVKASHFPFRISFQKIVKRDMFSRVSFPKLKPIKLFAQRATGDSLVH
jgi:hypothetical protein